MNTIENLNRLKTACSKVPGTDITSEGITTVDIGVIIAASHCGEGKNGTKRKVCVIDGDAGGGNNKPISAVNGSNDVGVGDGDNAIEGLFYRNYQPQSTSHDSQPISPSCGDNDYLLNLQHTAISTPISEDIKLMGMNPILTHHMHKSYRHFAAAAELHLNHLPRKFKVDSASHKNIR
ncbi:PREDICTED: uncharacterized protein LOC108381636 [Rhagoletis zephyria]|uniref:uncharacterized protein LOC108381636 n=1 Tax=Rhagoletis zephyria TaxID=28612 RepID=UPI0008115007|nr:PREDICTED: uncharacterized protein LOC108381636 [Rhagoletis zephyria]